MGMMKGNMMMMIPQTVIMGWINAFFAGFVISTWALRPMEGCYEATPMQPLPFWSGHYTDVIRQ